MNRSNPGRLPVDALREEIVHTRADLGETVQALAAKADVRSRMRASATHRAGRVRKILRDVERSRALPWMIFAAGTTAGLVVVLLSRGRPR